MDLIQEKNEQDIERLISDYGDSLLRMCFIYLKDLQLAEDAVQDTYLKACKSWHSFNRQSSEKTWLTRIAINVCKNYLRNPWFRRVDLEAELPDPGSDRSNTRDDTVLRAITKLSAKYREVILLYYYQEFKLCEIAKILSIPESTAAVRLKRAREKLKPELKGWYFDE